MANVRLQNSRHGLHLSIDSFSYDNYNVSVSPESLSPSSSPTLSTFTSSVTPTSDGPQWLTLSVLCMHDFDSRDPDHLPFKKNHILEIVKQEESGWWAAVSLDGKRVGWVPRAYVQELTPEMAEKLRSVREELRVYEYEAERLYNSAPIHHLHHLYGFDNSPHSPKDIDFPTGDNTRPFTPTRYRNDHGFPPSRQEVDNWRLSRPRPPPSPLTPMPQPPLGATLVIGRHSPPGPFTQRNDPFGMGKNLQRSRSAVSGSPDTGTKSRSTSEKIWQLTGSEDALAFHNAKQGFSTQPWYLRPNFTPDQLVMNSDLNVKAGTLNALIERLVTDPPSSAHETSYRNTFLRTFRTFTTPDVVFDALTNLYRMETPTGLNQAEVREWKEKRLSVVQKRTLTVLTMWLEDHGLLEEEPHIAQRLTDFLVLIVDPAPLALTAKLMLKSLERLTFAEPNTGVTPTVSPRRRRKTKPHKNDLLKLDPTDIAEQLCQLEHALYVKVRPQECLNWPNTQTGKSVENLHAFCATHDKLASWVKTSILENEALGRRADTVDLWIKVADKCRNLNNFASMSALINALSSTAITRLHLTWAHVGRKSILDALLKYNEPTGGFSGYRALLQNVEGPCVPFIGMFLVDLVHIQDQFSDALSPTAANPGKPLICFTKRQRWFDVISAMLKHQQRPYNFPESDATRSFIESHLQLSSMKDTSWFWTRSQEVQHTELAHADIRRGLVEAGF